MIVEVIFWQCQIQIFRDASQCHRMELMAKVAMECAQVEAKALKIELVNTQRRVEEAEAARLEADKAASQCQKNEMVAKVALENAQAEVEALKIELDRNQRRAKEAEAARPRVV